jgi:hypothetical protein
MITSGPTASPDRSAVIATGTRRRRLVEGFGFIAVWMGLGYLVPSNKEAYLLIGIPLTIGFQLLVRRRPLRELWVRDATTLTLGRRGLLLTSLFALAPVYYGIQALAEKEVWIIAWFVAAVAGAGAAAFALGSTSVLAVLRSALLPMAVGVLGNAIVLGGIHLATDTPVDVLAFIGTVLKYLAIYFPATFVIEEVAFRGALDSHVHHQGEGRGWQTALFVSALWGLWHLPVSDGIALPLLVPTLLAIHCGIGVPLSFAWRRSGNLAGAAFAHSAIDAVRNGLLRGL